MNYAARNGLLLSRIDRHAAHPAAAELRKAAENCFTVAQSYADFCDELAQDRFLTADGKRAKLAEARTKYEREMETARAPIDSAAKRRRAASWANQARADRPHGRCCRDEARRAPHLYAQPAGTGTDGGTIGAATRSPDS